MKKKIWVSRDEIVPEITDEITIWNVKPRLYDEFCFVGSEPGYSFLQITPIECKEVFGFVPQECECKELVVEVV